MREAWSGEGRAPAHRPRVVTPEPGPDLALRIVAALDQPLVVVATRQDAGAPPMIVHASRGVARLLGRDAEALPGQPVAALASAATEPLELARLIDAVARQRAIDLTMQIAAADARPLWAEVHGRPLPGAGGRYLVQLRDVTAQRFAATAAQQLERRFEALAELTSDGVYHLRIEADCRLVLDWTAGAFARLTGYSAAEIEAAGGWSALVEPTDLRIVQRRAQRLLAGEQASAEYRIRRRDGSRRWLRDTGWPQWDDGRELILGILCVVQDITELRALEEQALLHQLERRSLVGLTEGLLCETDGEGRLRAVAGDGGGELARRLRAGVGRPLQEMIGLDLADHWRRQGERVVPGWSPVSFTLSWPGGQGAEEEVYEVRMCGAAAGATLALLRPRPTSASALVPLPSLPPPLDARLRALLDLQAAPAVLLGPDAAVVELNEQAGRLTGWQRDQAIGGRFVELMGLPREQPSVLQDLARAQAGTRVVASEAWLRLPDGREGRLVWSFLPLRGAQGEVCGVLAQAEVLAALPAAPALSADDELRLRGIMNHIADGVVTLDAQGTIVAFSRAAEVIFGYRQDEIVGRAIDQLILPGAGEEAPPLDQVAALGATRGATRELRARRKGGAIVPLELSASEVRQDGAVLYVVTVRDIAIRRLTEETIRSLAYHDPLTGLPNRLLFNDRLTQAIERARRNQQMLAVMILDLDRFKLINDLLGLASGDQVLRAVGERLVAAVRRSDTVARLGADDFLLLLPGIDGAESAAKVGQKILDIFLPSLQVDDQEVHLGASLGITLFPHDGDDAETLIRNADTALYRAKEHSRGGYQFYTTDMNATAFERLVLETQLRKALERGEMVVHYQPQVRLDSGRVVAVEALVRWFHADLGLISPKEFIPLAEDTGLILDLGRWVLRTACTQVRRWQQQGFADLRLAVNLSSRQFEQDDLVRSIAQVMEEAAFDPADLELELTESAIMRRPEQAVLKLQALDRLGIRLSIDDFGTGYSSLDHLKRFPIRTLKIDQSFVQDITTDPNDAAIAQAIIALAESLQLKVIAEGVETREQLDLLRRYHCDEMQGYLFARPLPPAELLALLRSGSRLSH